ncbi:MAG: hypothetical protein NWE91_00520 [Candidatus Bathyarchaeota archaeon]|nr:hypothetical protein [Candidatus Bathyarchaeota archaeon]
MPTYPEPLRTWNTIVKGTVKRKAIHVESISPNQLVGNVTKDEEYHLWLSFKNTSNVELTYENIVIRLVGQPDQIDFIFPPGAIDYQGNPRIHLDTGRFSSGQERGWMIRFKARKTMQTRNLKFTTGIYGYLIPQGHYWTTLSPTV